MRIYRNGIFICSILCGGTFIALLCNVVCSVFWNVAMDSTIENILLGVFASAFVVLVTYIGAYLIEKKRTIGLLIHYCGTYIEELAHFIPMVLPISEDGHCKVNWDSIINQIENDASTHEVVKKLCAIHSERLYSVDGFYPIFRKNSNNLNAHRLFIMLAKVNTSLQYCDFAYNQKNNVMYKLEKMNSKYSTNELIQYLKVIFQIENTEYAEFISLIEKVSSKHKGKTVFEKGCMDKCT
ncbi:MAG: hypothetical protein IJW55_08010 [Clostridia bacterium]|nr:hypothetical protein [Clostridia bacterium]